MLLYSWSASPSHKRASDQSWTRWGETEVTGLAQQLDVIVQPFRTTEREEHIHQKMMAHNSNVLIWLGLTWARPLSWSNVLASHNLLLYFIFKIKTATLLSLQVWLPVFRCHSRLFSHQYSIYLHFMKKTSLVSQKLLVRHLCPIDGNAYRLPYSEEQQVPERDFQWTGRALGLCNRSSLPLLQNKTEGRQSGFILTLSLWAAHF